MSAETLARFIPHGSNVYATTERVSRNGDGRDVRLFAIVDGRILDITPMVADFVGYRIKGQRNGMYVTGGGMDVGLHVVDTLARKLYSDGGALGYARL